MTKPVNRDGLSLILKKYTITNIPGPVLLIEDDLVTRKVAREMLEKEGWKVREAANGLDALDYMERETPGLIVLDLLMPEMDGFEFAACVRKREEWRSIPIVVLTARELRSEDLLRLNGYVEKVLPVEGDSYEALLDQVRDLLVNCTAQAPVERLVA